MVVYAKSWWFRFKREVITKAILLETEGKVEIYKDNIKQTQNKPEDNKPEENKPQDNKPQDNKPQDNKPKDDTTANQKLHMFFGWDLVSPKTRRCQTAAVHLSDFVL